MIERDSEAEELLKKLVSINTQTNHLPGVEEGHHMIAEALRQMGFKVGWQRADETDGAPLLYAWYDDVLHPKASCWTLVSHIDTVLTPEAVGPYQVWESNSKATGSGVIDNKGGLVIAIRALQMFFDKHRQAGTKPQCPIRFVSSPNEEGGSTGFHSYFKQWSKNSHLILGFEPALDSGAIIDTRRGNRWYDISIVGREAHSGRCRGEELNAAHELALKIVALQKLARPKRGINLNIGALSGGRGPFNVVCGEARAKLDVRFATFKDRDKLHGQIEKILGRAKIRSKLRHDRTKTSYILSDDCPPFSATRKSRKLIKKLLRRISSIEQTPAFSTSAGGAGDVNHFSHPGAVVIDGLGPVGSSMHTVSEEIYLPSLSSRARALAEFLFEDV